MTEIILNSRESLQSFIGDIRQRWERSKFLRVVVRERTRSLDQNAVTHAWYAQLARELPENDALGWKAYAKLHHGVPILRAEDADFRAFYDAGLKGLAYEQKLAAMRFVPVTSHMTVPQLTAYMAAMQDDFAQRGVWLVVETPMGQALKAVS